MTKPKTKQVIYEGDNNDPLNNRPVHWVTADDVRWKSLYNRYVAERGYEPWPMYSTYGPGSHPGWFFPLYYVDAPSR